MDALVCHMYINGAYSHVFHQYFTNLWRVYCTQFYPLVTDKEKRKDNVFLIVYNYSMCNQSTKTEYKLRNSSLINSKDFSIHHHKGTYRNVGMVPLILNFNTRSNSGFNL